MLSRTHRLRLVVTLVAAHSILLGLAMMLFPAQAMRLIGWDPPADLFFASQSGLFLLILGAAYAAAARHRPFIALIVGSKAAAAVFLLASVAVFDVPGIIVALGLGDGALGGLVLWEYLACRRWDAR